LAFSYGQKRAFLLHIRQMENQEDQVFAVQCPCCHAQIWIDASTREVIKSEKAARKKSSLDDLLIKEEKKRKEADQKFISTAELERKKKQEARDKFARAIQNLENEN
jgi:hypothetical protein